MVNTFYSYNLKNEINCEEWGNSFEIQSLYFDLESCVKRAPTA